MKEQQAQKAAAMKRNRFERKLDEYNHTMELVRTLLPIVMIVLQVVILVKVI